MCKSLVAMCSHMKMYIKPHNNLCPLIRRCKQYMVSIYKHTKKYNSKGENLKRNAKISNVGCVSNSGLLTRLNHMHHFFLTCSILTSDSETLKHNRN